MVTASPRTVTRAHIASIATYLPPKVLSNADLEQMVETTDEWILQRTGIRERHIADRGVGTSDLAYEASKKAIERAGLTANDIDLIIVGTTTPDMAFPSIPMIEFFGRGGALKPSWYGDCLPSRDFPMLIDLYLQGRLDLEGFVTDTIPLDGVEDAFHRMEQGEVLRSVVVF